MGAAETYSQADRAEALRDLANVMLCDSAEEAAYYVGRSLLVQRLETDANRWGVVHADGSELEVINPGAYRTATELAREIEALCQRVVR